MTAPSCHSLPWPSSAAPLGVARCLPAACLRTGWSCTVCTSCPPSCAYPSSRQGARWWGRSPWPPQMVSESCICNKPGVTPYPNTPRVLPPSQASPPTPIPLGFYPQARTRLAYPARTPWKTGQVLHVSLQVGQMHAIVYRPHACYSLHARCMLQPTGGGKCKSQTLSPQCCVHDTHNTSPPPLAPPHPCPLLPAANNPWP